ncbi:MAG: methane monooxygenase/ammonia monooxygenase subunit B [Actinomycetes bacterium]
MRRRILLILVAAALVTAVPATAASAHGEKSQEGFLRMRTVGWTDVNFSGDTVQQGQTVTVTGKIKIMDAWPSSLAKGVPNTCFMSMIAPGPVIVLKERTLNGESVPTRIDCAKGRVYDFSMTFAGRRVGRWHIHPAFAVKGAGTLIGPGAWINVKKNPAGFVNQATLLGGKTVNLENYQLPFIWIWLTLTFIIGMVWMIYWTVPKRTIPHLAVTSQIPLNTDGAAYGLITKKDHRNSTIMMLATVVLLGAGWIYQLANFPTKIPQQIIQFAPANIARPAPFVSPEAGKGKAIYDAGKKQVILEATVTNTDTQPAQLTQFAVADLTWFNQAVPSAKPAGPQAVDTSYPMTVQSDTIAPGATQQVTVTMPSDVWIHQERLLPIGESQLTVTGLLRFQTPNGNKTDVEVDEPLTPTAFTT